MKMLEQVQKMQQDMRAAQDALESMTVEGTAGGGVVRATANGQGELRGITIDPGVVDPADVETLEDLVVAAVSDALRKARALQEDSLGAATGGLDLGGMGLGDMGKLLD
ncbi:MAG: YbaB/EbfC family nucleoid-associated protein [Actinomycetota bacterium]